MEAVGNDALRLRDHSLNDLSGRYYRVDQTSILSDQKGGMVRIACLARCQKCLPGSARLLTERPLSAGPLLHEPIAQRPRHRSRPDSPRGDVRNLRYGGVVSIAAHD